MSQNDDAHISKWKNRYYDCVEAQDELGQNMQRQRDVFTHVLNRLSIAAHGLDPQLDPQLEALRQLSKDDHDDDALTNHLKHIADKLVRSETDTLAIAEIDDSAEDDRLTAVWQLLEQLPLSSQERKRLLALREQTGEPDALVDQLARLLSSICSDHGQQDPQNRPSLPDALRSVLEQLPLSKPLAETAESIRGELEKPLDTQGWTRLLHGIADLFIASRKELEAEKQEVENFLGEMTERLRELDAQMQGISDGQNASADKEAALDQAVQNEVDGMASSVEGASELQELKSDFRQRMEALRKHMEDRRRSETDRREQTESQLEQLQGRLSTMEEEAAELREQMHQARKLAMNDPLTGVPNRLAWDQRLSQEHDRWSRYGEPLTLVIWDVDRFKRINDEFGHPAGDKALVVIARILKRLSRKTDFLARFGGEEFVMLLPSTNVEQAKVVAEKVRATVAAAGFHFGGRQVPITISGGITTMSKGDNPETALARADSALYKAKNNGRNRVEQG